MAMGASVATGSVGGAASATPAASITRSACHDSTVGASMTGRPPCDPPVSGRAVRPPASRRRQSLSAATPVSSTSYYEDSRFIPPCSDPASTWGCAPWTQGYETPATGAGALVVMDMGAPCFVPATGMYGTQMFDEETCTPSAQEVPLVTGFVRGYEAGHSAGTAASILAVGLSNSHTDADPQANYLLTTQQLTAQAADFYTTLIGGMSASAPATLTVWGANDMEQSGDGNWYGPGDTSAWVDAYGAAAGISGTKPACSAATPGMLADFGDDVVGNGGWQAADVYHVAWGAPVACALPEIYYSSMASEWAQLNRWAAANGRPLIQFTGVMSENGAAGTLDAASSWSVLQSATGQAVPYLTTIVWSTSTGWQHFAAIGDGPLGGPPQAVSWGGGHADVFWRGGDGGLWHAWFWQGTWNGPQSLGGSLAGDPSAVSWGFGHIDVFWKGTDGQLWHVYYLDGWHAPESLGGGPLGSGPRAVTDGVGWIGVYWTGTDGNLWEMRYADGWSGPYGLGGGPLASDPQPVARGPGSVSVLWTGSDRNLWRMDLRGGSWVGPIGVYAANDIQAAPSPVSWGGGHIDVFWPRADGSIWHSWVNTLDAPWSGPAELTDAHAATRITGVSFGFAHLQVFWEDTSQNLWEDEFAGGWLGPVNLDDGPIASLPTAVAGGPGLVDVLWRGTDSQTSLWHDWHP